ATRRALAAGSCQVAGLLGGWVAGWLRSWVGKVGAGSFVENLMVFGRLRLPVGFDVPVGLILDLTEALGHVDLNARDEVFHTCRALLVQRHEQLATFDVVFDAFWRDHSN